MSNPDRGKFSSWIFTIAHNVVVDCYKKSAKVDEISIDLITEQTGNNDKPESKLVNQEIKNNLLEVLQKLDERKRNIIALKFWGEPTNRRIAKILGLSESNVGVIVYRAMQELKTLLETWS